MLLIFTDRINEQIDNGCTDIYEQCRDELKLQLIELAFERCGSISQTALMIGMHRQEIGKFLKRKGYTCKLELRKGNPPP